MPTYEYACDACDFTFEELLLSREEIREHEKSHPCPSCGRRCGRVPSAANFNFKGKAFGDPTNTKGSSGVHDLDYPSLDKAIGRSAKRKWQEHAKKKEARDRVRRETGAVAVSEVGGRTVPTDPSVLKLREQGLKTFKKARES